MILKPIKISEEAGMLGDTKVFRHVVVDRNAEINIVDFVWNNGSKTVDQVIPDSHAENLTMHLMEDNVCILSAARDYKHPKVIATIGHQHSHFPQIVMKDQMEDELKIFKRVLVILLQNYSKDHELSSSGIRISNWLNHYLENNMSVIDIYKAAQQSKFSEEQVREAMMYSMGYGVASNGRDIPVEERNKAVTNYLQSLNAPKEILELGVESKLMHGMSLAKPESMQSKINSDNTITAISVKYKT